MRSKRRDTVRLVVLVLAVLAMTGCWPQRGYGPEHRYWNGFEERLTAANAATLEQSWFVDFPDEDTVNGLGGGIGAPIVWGGRVIVRPNDAATGVHIAAYDISTGNLDWDAALDPGGRALPFWSEPAIVDGQVVMSWPTSQPTAAGPCPVWEARVDPATGAVLGRTDLYPLAPFAGNPFGDRIVHYAWEYQPGRCDQLANIYYAVRDAATGALLWRADGDLIEQMPMVAQGRMYVAEPQRVVGYDTDGCGARTCPPDWVVHVGQTPGALLEANGFLYGAYSGGIVAISTAVEQIAWTADTNTPAGHLAYAGGLLYFAAEGVLQVYDARGCGAPLCPALWTAPLADPATWLPTGVTVAGGVVYVARSDPQALPPVGRVVAFDAAGCGAPVCDALWSSPLQPGQIDAVVVSDGTLIAEVESTWTRPSRLVAFAPAEPAT